MDSDGLPIVGAGVDYTKVAPFHQKRTLTFLNHFLIHTTSFLNHFATICDEKLENLLVRIQRLEASMCILEAKLTSIPGLDDITLNSQDSPQQEEPPQAQPENIPSSTPENVAQPNVTDTPSAPKSSEPEEKQFMRISQDVRFAKYFKMVNMGVPVPAVKLKMNAEGVNPDILDDPDAEAPPNDFCGKNPTDASDESSGSDSSD